QRKGIRDQATIETVPLDLPETSFETEAVWYVPEPHHLEGLEKMPTLLSSLHAAEHSMIALLPLWAMCDRWDIGGLSTNVHYQTGRATVFVYDGHPGGVGIAEPGFEAVAGWRAEPNAAAIAREHEALSALLADAGAEVVVAEPLEGNPDAVYVFDPALVVDDGLVLLNPGKELRRSEAEPLAAALPEIPVAA